MRPGWVKPCECGTAERGAYCPECRGFGDGYNGGTWERPTLTVEVRQRVERLVEEAPDRELPSAAGPWCPGGHRGATVRGNAAYCAECKGRIRPAASYKAGGVGTGH